MSNTTLHWEFRAALRHFRPDGTLAVYMAYLLHANIRGRAWPSVNLLIAETGWARASIVSAKQWLVTCEALERVAFTQRVGADETALHQRLDIMQITGVIRIDGVLIPLLYFNQRTNEAVNSSVGESMVGESMVGEISLTEPEVVSLPKVVPIPKGFSRLEGRGTPSAHSRKKSYASKRVSGDWDNIES